MVDYQFLGLVAVGSALLTGGALVPALALTALVAVLLLGYEAVARRYRRHRAHPATGGPVPDDASAPDDAELTRWMAVVDRVLRSDD